MERRIKAEYQKAYDECYAKLQAVTSKIQTANGKIPPRKMLGLLAQRKKLDNLCKQMGDTIANAGKVSASLINSATASVYADTYNAFAEVLEFSLVTQQDVVGIIAGNVDPFNRLALQGLADDGPIKREMESQIITGLLRGESIPKIGKRLQTAAEGRLSNAVRVARTEVTRIESSAANDICKKGDELGFDMGNRWYATRDKRTREGHRAADRQEVPLGVPFRVPVIKKGVLVRTDLMLFPGDVSLGAGPDNVCNCRCRVVPYIIGIKKGALQDNYNADVDTINSRLSVK